MQTCYEVEENKTPLFATRNPYTYSGKCVDNPCREHETAAIDGTAD